MDTFWTLWRSWALSRYFDRISISFKNNQLTTFVPVAQLDRVSDYGSEGCRFNSCRAHAFFSLGTHLLRSSVARLCGAIP